MFASELCRRKNFSVGNRSIMVTKGVEVSLSEIQSTFKNIVSYKLNSLIIELVRDSDRLISLIGNNIARY